MSVDRHLEPLSLLDFCWREVRIGPGPAVVAGAPRPADPAAAAAASVAAAVVARAEGVVAPSNAARCEAVALPAAGAQFNRNILA